jgi:ParB family chromosome partitioning protein
MSMDRLSGQRLRSIPPEDIRPNPENPRLIFRQEEMESLMLSIDKHGIQVPVTVYEDQGVYWLLDGERRWRCARKLNLKAVPAIVQGKPSELENLVLMYNIHALREQWDYYTIASKLQRVIDLFSREQGTVPGEAELSDLTGLTRGAIRRCQLLLNLPQRFKDMLLQELEKPKSQQRLSEDFFIEMEKSLKAVVRRVPEYEGRIDEIRDALVIKFENNLIGAVTDFRQLSKIGTALDTLDIQRDHTVAILDRVFDPEQKVGIREAYSEAVAFEYVEKKATRNALDLEQFIAAIVAEDRVETLDGGLIERLEKLHRALSDLLGK